MNQQKFRKNRQTIKISFTMLIFTVLFLPLNISAQETNSKIDYSVKSNILNPDTLKGDQKLIFWHFVELTHKQSEDLKPLEIKADFEKLGITTKERARFVKAFTFFDCFIISHKKSIENWQSFIDLSN